MRLKYWLIKNKVTIFEFARRAGITHGYIHMMMRRYKTPSKKVMDKIRELTKGQVQRYEDLRTYPPEKPTVEDDRGKEKVL